MTIRTAFLTLALAWGVWAQANPTAASTPPLSFAELEARGTRFGEIRVVALDIFDTSDPQENYRLFRLANALHIQTRPSVVARALLFRSGDPVSVQVLDETERLLRDNRFLSDVRIRPVAVRGDRVDVEVQTRDAWSLDMGASVGRTGGSTSTGLRLRDFNLLGSGITVGVGHSTTADRSGTTFEFANARAFGGQTAIRLSHADNSDGQRSTAVLENPFSALDKRWAAGVKVLRDERIDSIYRSGQLQGQYRHQERQTEVYAGWSAGLKAGWVQRYSLGLQWQEDRHSPTPDAGAAPVMPPDQQWLAPFVRFERIEDRFEKELNRNLVGRPEYFALGQNLSAQLGRTTPRLGDSDSAWLYAASLSRGFELGNTKTLMLAGKTQGQWRGGLVQRQHLSVQSQYFQPHSPRWLFYAAASGDALTRPQTGETLLLGGDNGLRGYPMRYQNGTRRALFTVEERFYTDLYFWRLLRLGGAVYLDAGRAWGGQDAGAATPAWLSNVGAGLRIVATRSALSNVLHIDLAFPLNAPADVKRVQFLVKTKASF